jgi:hypothetical protein
MDDATAHAAVRSASVLDRIHPMVSLFLSSQRTATHKCRPRMRSHFAAVHNRVPFDTFFIPYTTTISVNWPYSPRDVLIPASKVHPSSLSAPSVSSMPTSPYSTSPATPQSQPHSSHEDEQWVMNPAFEAHVRNIANWSLGTAFQAAFPNSVEGVSIKENDNR